MNQSISKSVLVASAVIVALSQLVASTAQAEPGLLIIAHGAPSPKWNDPVLEFGQKVTREALKGGQFSQPDVPGAVAELEAEGCDRIIAVPLFIAPSGHSHFDVPAVLGIYSSPEIRAVIAEENGAIAQPRVPITLTQTLAGGDVLCEFALGQVRKLSQDAENEALVLIAHGDPGHRDLIDGLMRRIMTYCCGQAGIDYGDWAYVGMGLGHLEHGLPTIMKALEAKKRVLVVGVYVSSSARSIHQRVFTMAKLAGKLVMPDLFDGFDEESVAFSEQGVVTHPGAVQWVLDSAKSVLEPFPQSRAGGT